MFPRRECTSSHNARRPQENIDNGDDKSKAIRTEVSRGREGRHESLEGRLHWLEEKTAVVSWQKQKKSIIAIITRRVVSLKDLLID